ncbi:MAG: SusC/RagA family TonB-linked outer membrane protein [Reichenbachiella sp.]|uniref:SusC/RagA family TonB-linked outer membrane protein n=1 Tax=Reichenbachiella sp. TaxID=2184521 RepID=UPI0032646301
MRKLLLIFLFVSGLIAQASAQDRTVSGKVTSAEDDSTLPGVTVVLKGTTTGTTTDLDGNYKLSVPSEGGTLVYSFVGLSTQELEIGSRSVIDLVMQPDAQQLTEVVVTAMGVSREKASLGYAQQTLGTEDVNRVKSDNIIGSLSGKAAGVQVRQTTAMGGSAVINIRGNSSFTNNNPLFVIDGVPVSNRTSNTAVQAQGRRGYDYGNPASDINPEDVESMSILKGAAATALYGSRGQNGVILITTKKGTSRKGIGVELSTGVTIGKIDKSTFAKYQNEYGAGYGPYYGSHTPNGAIYAIDVNGDGNDDNVVPTTEDASYGDALDGSISAYQWDSFVPGEANFGQSYPYVAGSTTPVDFFETQVIKRNSIALTGGGELATFRFGYTNHDQDDILPNSSLKKHTFNFNATTKMSEKLSADVMMQYNKQNAVGRFSTGYSDNLMSQFRQWWQVNVDVKQLERVYNRTGLNYTWNGASHDTPLVPIYWDNPYWTRYENFNSDTRDRFLTKFGFQYKLTDWLSVNGRVSLDNYTETREERRAVGSIAAEFGVNLTDEPSGYARTDIENHEWNYNAMLNFNKQLNDDLNLAGLVGFNLQKERYSNTFGSTSGGLAVPGLYALSNSVGTNPFPVETLWEKEIYSYFANVNLGYKDFLYLDANYRTDISSALPVANNQYDYFGVGVGFVFSELVDVSWMDFGKVRASIGQVGNDTRALRVNDTYARVDNFGSTVMTTVRSNKNNSNLKPEITTETEVGFEGSFLDRRVNVDFAWYSRETTDQLMPVEISRATGYSSTFVNVGTIENKGIEMVLSGDIVRTDALKYNLAINFTRNRNKVLDLNDADGNSTDNYTIQSYQGNISSNATVGEPLGVLKGTGYQYLDGRRVVDSQGRYLSEADQIIGDPNPDYLLGFNNTVSFKGITLGFLIDVSQGGDVYSLDMHYGQGTGVLEHTAGLNDLGNPIRNPVTTDATSGGVLNEGVMADGSENTTRAPADYFGGAFYWGNATRNPGEMTVYDASFVKLREMRLTYSLPSSLVGSWSQGVDISVVGRNLWIINKNVPYADPESGLGGQFSQGYLSGSYPTVRSVGFDIKITL